MCYLLYTILYLSQRCVDHSFCLYLRSRYLFLKGGPLMFFVLLVFLDCQHSDHILIHDFFDVNCCEGIMPNFFPLFPKGCVCFVAVLTQSCNDEVLTYYFCQGCTFVLCYFLCELGGEGIVTAVCDFFRVGNILLLLLLFVNTFYDEVTYCLTFPIAKFTGLQANDHVRRLFILLLNRRSWTDFCNLIMEIAL